MKNRFIAFFLLIAILGNAQDYEFFVSFVDKSDNEFNLSNPQDFLSERAIERRVNQQIPLTEEDLPVSSKYLDSLTSYDVMVQYTSKWFNGAIIRTDSLTFETLLTKSFIEGGEVIGQIIAGSFAPQAKFSLEEEGHKNYGTAQRQIEMLGAQYLHQEGFKGEGVFLAVLDAGFTNVSNIPAFEHLFTNNRLLYTWDLPQSEPISFSVHNHGTAVLSTIVSDFNDQDFGIAPNVDLALMRTEIASLEQPIEEYYWIIAVEKADSLGVDIINTSLGYSKFDEGWRSHSYEELNGEDIKMSKAAEIAASKGMLLVVSAGNSGGRDWGYITVPADADSILTVGSVNSNQDYSGFSSVGPTADGRIKPDVAALGEGTAIVGAGGDIASSSGTSLSGPLISGFAALLWQKNPNLSAMELREEIKQMGNQYNNPDTLLGYGVPQYAPLTSLNEWMEERDLQITPQPVINQLKVNGEGALRIYNATGKLMLQDSVYESQMIDVSGYKPGVYLLILDGEQEQFFKL